MAIQSCSIYMIHGIHIFIVIFAFFNTDAAVRSVKKYRDGTVTYDLLLDLRQQGDLKFKGVGEKIDSNFNEDLRIATFQAPTRMAKLSDATTRDLLRDLSSNSEFAFLLTLKQEVGNIGSLISFANSHNRRIVELQSAWRKEEIRFHYVIESPISMIHVERLAYQLADNQWHRLALTISGNTISLLIDCNKIYEKVLYKPLKEQLFRAHDINVWIGQRGPWSSYFKGEIQEAKVVVGHYASLQQCPHLDAGCPTCGQFKQLVAAVESLQKEVHRLKTELKTTNQKVEHLSSCDCIVRCKHKGLFYEDGEVWKSETNECHECKCQKGVVQCGPKNCPVVNCTNPVHMKGDCCPKCLRSCDLFGIISNNWSPGADQSFQHGTNITSLSEIDEHNRRMCVRCQCQDGNIECFTPQHHVNVCPRLKCPKYKQKTNFVDCCPYCHDFDHCQDHKCDPIHGRCVNLHNRYECRCQPGFHGNGYQCEDVDECASGEHQCQSNTTVCINSLGSYVCHCRKGYVRRNQFSCQDDDECSRGTHSCSAHATCQNTMGSYNCTCKAGYIGDGKGCQAICDAKCQNGGTCVEPNKCRCPVGFAGHMCEQDIDECTLGIHKCHENSYCVNLPGSYHCRCKKGFHDNGKENIYGQMCRDIDECSGINGMTHSCPSNTKCVNTNGAYQCICTEKSCETKNCLYRPSLHRSIVVQDGAEIRNILEACSVCKCKAGYLRCQHMTCDCSKLDNFDRDCCPSCASNNASAGCMDEVTGKRKQSGDVWLHGCEMCQCLNGITDCHPVQCPPVSCPHPSHSPGTCCPSCSFQNPCYHNIQNKFRLGPAHYCTYSGHRFGHGVSWTLHNNSCILCHCSDGHICCAHDSTCSKEQPTTSSSTSSAVSSTITTSSSTEITDQEQQTSSTTSSIEATDQQQSSSTTSSIEATDQQQPSSTTSSIEATDQQQSSSTTSSIEATDQQQSSSTTSSIEATDQEQQTSTPTSTYKTTERYISTSKTSINSTLT